MIVDAITVSRGLLRAAHEFLEGTVADVPADRVHWTPPGAGSSIAANYVHVLATEDMTVQGLLKGGQPLAATSWAGKMGVSEPPPMGLGQDLRAWGETARVELGPLRQYAQAVYAATDEFLQSLKPEDLERPYDLSAFGFGQQPMLFLVTNLLLNPSLHCGEISGLKGLSGARGYPV